MLLSFDTPKKTSEVREKVKYIEKLNVLGLNKNLNWVYFILRRETLMSCGHWFL
jgi:hypothetical protein